MSRSVEWADASAADVSSVDVSSVDVSAVDVSPADVQAEPAAAATPFAMIAGDAAAMVCEGDVCFVPGAPA